MMENDGGSAFPVSRGHFTDDGKLLSSDWLPGMSLRDWFAGQAQHDDLDIISRTDAKKLGADYSKIVSAARYAYADAMLAERDKEVKP